MQLNLIDQTTNPKNKPSAEILKCIQLAGARVVGKASALWGDNTKLIINELDGFPIFFVDDLPEAPGALAYHDNDPQTGPYARVGVGTIFQYSSSPSWLNGPESVCMAALHEVLEMLGDPIANQWSDDGQGTSWAQELCDPVQNIDIPIHVQPVIGSPQVLVSVPDFILPGWFNPFSHGPYDYMRKATSPFDYSNGYAIQKVGGNITQVFADGTPDYVQAAKTNPKSNYMIRGGK